MWGKQQILRIDRSLGFLILDDIFSPLNFPQFITCYVRVNLSIGNSKIHQKINWKYVKEKKMN